MANPILKLAKPAVLESDLNTTRLGVFWKFTIGRTLSPVNAS